MKYLTALVWATLFAGVVVLLMTANSVVTLLGMYAIGMSLIAFATIAATTVLRHGSAAYALRNEDFHWY